MSRKLGLKNGAIVVNEPVANFKLLARKAPAVCMRPHIDPDPLMFANDRLSDCTAAGVGNSIRAAAAIGGYMIDMREDNAIDFYSASTGYSPNVSGSDGGSTGPNALDYASKNGFPVSYATMFPLWGTVRHTDRNAVANIIDGLATCAIGVGLSESDMNQINATDGVCTLYRNNSLHGDITPGSAGGHFLLMWEYEGLGDNDPVTLLTWGSKTVKCTWDWFNDRAFEAHSVIWRQLSKPDGKYVTNEDFDRLADNNAICRVSH